MLDGGLPKWLSSGYPVEKGPQPSVPAVPYNPTFNPTLLRNLDQVKQAQDDKTEQVRVRRLVGNQATASGFVPRPSSQSTLKLLE